MLMKINIYRVDLLAFSGALLVILGLFLPWFSFVVYIQGLDEPLRVEFSPFLLKVQGAPFWFEMNLGVNLVGVLCILAATLGVTGGVFDRERMRGVGGVLALIGTFLFPSCLAGYYRNLTIQPGGLMSALGSFIMFFSAVFQVYLPNISELKKFFRVFLPDEAGSFMEGLNYILKFIAVVGSIYSGVELSRLVNMLVSDGSFTIGLGYQSPWLLMPELLLCLFTVVYWSAHIAFYAIRKLKFK